MRRIATLTLAVFVFAMTLSAFAQMGRERLNRLLELLSDKDYRVRLQSTVVLAKLKDQRAMPGLISALKDKHPLVRAMAASGLGLLGDTRALAPLKECLKDSDALVRKRAKAALEVMQRKKPPRTGGSKTQSTILLRIAGVGDKTQRGKALVPELRRFWAERIEASPGLKLTTALKRAPGQKIYEVNSAITELTKQRKGTKLELTCSVSMILGDHKGSIVMMASGAATVQMDSIKPQAGQEKYMQTTALEGAVESAHSNLLRFFATRHQ
jgi:hypothetical protein